ncbi:MAG: dephospho-CoA kinase [Rickettsiales bacterium]
MIVIGLTGSIGMGKSTVADQFSIFGAKTCSADRFVHKLMGVGGKAIGEIKKYFPEAVTDNYIDRQILGEIVFSDKKKLILLEDILHPSVIDMENKFIYRQKRLGTKIIVLDIPLLFETGGDERVDFTVVVTAPYFIQRQRVLGRENMTEEKFERIMASQMDDGEKRGRADFIIPTSLGRAYSFKRVKEIVMRLEI